jgi:hypothetical protein
MYVLGSITAQSSKGRSPCKAIKATGNRLLLLTGPRNRLRIWQPFTEWLGGIRAKSR